MFNTVTKKEFDAFLANTTTHSEPSIEADGGYSYEVWTNFDDEEVAQIIYRNGEDPVYQIAA